MKFGRLASLTPLILTLSLTACGGGGSDDPPADGSPDGSGSAGPRAQEVNCTTAVTKEVKSIKNMNQSFSPPSLTVTKGSIVRFIMDETHDARSSEGLFLIEERQTECVRFNTAGTYIFSCTPHGFPGMVIVQ